MFKVFFNNSSSSSSSTSSSSSSSLPTKTNLKDMNFSEKEQLNKIKQQTKNIQAEITKNRLAILEMRRYIKDKNKLYDDLTNQENELSATITFSLPFIEKPEEELKEEIANKIERDRFLQYQDTVNYSEIEKNTNLQNEKF
jgi:hypothetical protein